MSPTTLEAIVTFIYTDRVDENVITTSLLKAADMWNITTLFKLCESRSFQILFLNGPLLFILVFWIVKNLAEASGIGSDHSAIWAATTGMSSLVEGAVLYLPKFIRENN